jgi:hypothetical protein
MRYVPFDKVMLLAMTRPVDVSSTKTFAPKTGAPEAVVMVPVIAPRTSVPGRKP